MEHTFLKKAKEMLEERRKRARLRQAVTAMMVLVAFSTSYLLMMPAITMGERTPTCGIEAHEHDDSCYETLLVCSDGSKPGHSHGDSCYSESYTCGQEEQEAHSHSDACWSVSCGQKEGVGHSHDDGCYGNACGQSESTGHTHRDACYGIACGESESVGHSHSDACYTESRSLSCGQSESAGHNHGGSCYNEEGSLVCGESESAGHSHGDACYETSRNLTCGQSECAGHTHDDACNRLICGQSESAGHTHNDGCSGVICGEEEYEAHTHSDACKSMTCGQSESAGHTHDDSCKTRSTEPTCGLEECEAVVSDHIHGAECYVTRLVCIKTVHTHAETCYAADDESNNSENPDSSTQQSPVGEVPEEILPELPVEPTEIILSDDVLNQLVGLDNDLLEDLELPEEPDYSDSLVVDQTVTRGEDGIYTLTLEAYAKGELDPTSMVHPVDLVLVLDQSADLYVPALGEAELDITADDSALDEVQVEEAAETWGLMNRASFLYLLDEAEFSENLVLTKARQRGYFLAQSAGTEDSTGEWYLVQYLPEEGWLVEALADESESVIYENISEMAEELPAHIQRFYVSRLGQQCDQIASLAEVLAASEADHRIAIVGYAGAETEGSVLLTGEGVTYTELTDGELDSEEIEAICSDALIPVADEYEVVNEDLLQVLSNVSCGHSGSSLAAGLNMAEQILATADPERDQMVVLMVNSQPDQDLSGCEDADWAVLDAINTAYTIKNSSSADIYIISSDLDEDLAACISSKYPQAVAEFVTEEVPEGEEASEPELVITTGEEVEADFIWTSEAQEEQMDAILDLGQQIVANTVELNGTAVLSAAIADYFQLFQADAEELEAPQIKVYTADYLGADTFSEEWVEFVEAQVELIASEEDRIQYVDVSNFNFSDEILSEADELSGIAAGGCKLIVQLPVEVREGFWGGNNVPVASEDTGIYVGEENVKEFPVPEVNVEMTLELESGTATVFYGQTVGIDDLVVELTVGGVEVTVDSDGAFIPQSDWMDDYAELTWVEKPEEICSTEKSDGHTIVVNLSPLYDGENALGAPVGMGIENSEEPAAEIPVSQEEGEDSVGLFNLLKNTAPEESIVGLNAIAEISVQVMTPVITFRDIVISLGNQPDFSTATHNPVEAIEWVSADEGISVADGSNTPDLTFAYSPLVEEDAYLLDTPMNVTVLHDGNDITDIATFAANVCDFNLHDADESIDSHKQLTESNEDLPEFWVHVQSGIELPETGGMGTKIFFGLGGVLMVGAVILLVTKKRMADNEDDEDEEDL